MLVTILILTTLSVLLQAVQVGLAVAGHFAIRSRMAEVRNAMRPSSKGVNG